MMEGPGGVAIADLRIRDGERESVYRSYTFRRMHQPNLTVLTGALVSPIKSRLSDSRVNMAAPRSNRCPISTQNPACSRKDDAYLPQWPALVSRAISGRPVAGLPGRHATVAARVGSSLEPILWMSDDSPRMPHELTE